MMNPLLSLIIGLAVLAVLAYLFFPEKGYFAKSRKRKQDAKRVLMEDALKVLYDFEYNATTCTVENIKKSLGISEDSAIEVVNKLKAMNKVQIEGLDIRLTNDGRSDALRIIRIHRLWERYLADETSVDENEWHENAEFLEHETSNEKMDELAAQLSNPVYDPHGDPIPGPNGEMPPNKGTRLCEMEIGRFATIIHLEDEPAAVYAQLTAFGLHKGMQVRLLKKEKEKLMFEANGEEVVLAPLFCRNITVVPIKRDEDVVKEFRTLSSLKQDESAEVVGISQALRGQQRRRLMDLGVVPGTIITAELEATSGDPIAFRIRGASIALRKKQTDLIFIKEPVDEEVNV